MILVIGTIVILTGLVLYVFYFITTSGCKHDWEKISETYAPPVASKVTSYSEVTLQRCCFGVTTILFQCQSCKKIRKEEMLGRSIKQ